MKKPEPGRELEHLAAAEVDARRAGLEGRDERRVPREDADLAGRAGHDQHLRLAAERVTLGGDDRDVELRVLVGHYAAAAAVFSALATAPSIVPTM